jgi:hypothetical protein
MTHREVAAMRSVYPAAAGAAGHEVSHDTVDSPAGVVSAAA